MLNRLAGGLAFLADLVMLPQDIMTMPAKEIPSMKVLMTMVGGKIVYQRDGFQAAISRRK